MGRPQRTSDLGSEGFGQFLSQPEIVAKVVNQGLPSVSGYIPFLDHKVLMRVYAQDFHFDCRAPTQLLQTLICFKSMNPVSSCLPMHGALFHPRSLDQTRSASG